MVSDSLGFGLVGLGRISRAHLRGYREASPAARLVAVCDIDAERANAIATETGARPCSDLDEMLTDAAVEAVDVALPHHLHYGAARRALEAGKHVLLEKPMASNTAECADLVALAEDRGLWLGVSENTRFVAAYGAARRLLAAGELGVPRLVRTFIHGSSVVLNRPGTWKSRKDEAVGGAIFDAGAHSFYLLAWLFGDVVELQAAMHRLAAASEVEDHGVVTGRLASGALFTTEYNFTAELPWGERLEIYGSAGTLIVDQLCNPPVRLFRGRTDWRGDAVPDVDFDPEGWKEASIARCVHAFAEAVHDGRTPEVTGEDGLYPISLIEAAYASIDNGGSVQAVGARQRATGASYHRNSQFVGHQGDGP